MRANTHSSSSDRIWYRTRLASAQQQLLHRPDSFSGMDTNHDGVIDRAEFEAAHRHEHQPEHRPEPLSVKESVLVCT